MRFHHLCGSPTERSGGANQTRRKRTFRALASSFAIGLMTALRNCGELSGADGSHTFLVPTESCRKSQGLQLFLIGNSIASEVR